MDFNEFDTDQLIELVNQAEDKEILRNLATHLEVPFSGNTGVPTLKEKLNASLNAILEEENKTEEPEVDPDLNVNDPVAKALMVQNAVPKEEDVHVKEERHSYTVEEMMEMDAAKVADPNLRKKVIRTQALRLCRVRITNTDPADANVPGAIFSVVSRYTGKISKFIPFEDEFYENGYHVPKCLLDDLDSRTYNARKEVRRRDGAATVGVKQYKTVAQKKFIIEYLPDLSKAELRSLGDRQAASGTIAQTG